MVVMLTMMEAVRTSGGDSGRRERERQRRQRIAGQTRSRQRIAIVPDTVHRQALIAKRGLTRPAGTLLEL